MRRYTCNKTHIYIYVRNMRPYRFWALFEVALLSRLLGKCMQGYTKSIFKVVVLVPHGAGGALPPGACSRRSLGHLPTILHWNPPRTISAPRGQPSFTSPHAGQPWSGPSWLLRFAAAPGTLGHRVLAAISARRVCGLHFEMLTLEFQLPGDRPHFSRWPF